MSNPNPQNQFKPGVSGNPKGPPKKDNSWRAIYDEAFDEIVEESGDPKSVKLAAILKIEKMTWKRAIARVVRRKGLAGDISHINNAQDRMEGKPKQEVKSTDTVKITFDNPEEKDV